MVEELAMKLRSNRHLLESYGLFWAIGEDMNVALHTNEFEKSDDGGSRRAPERVRPGLPWKRRVKMEGEGMAQGRTKLTKHCKQR